MPKPLRRTTIPSCSSRASAWRTVVREISKCPQSSDSDGSRSPVRKRPVEIACSITPASWNQYGTGEARSMRLCGRDVIL